MTDLEKHEQVTLMHTSEAESAVNGPLFRKLDFVADSKFCFCFTGVSSRNLNVGFDAFSIIFRGNLGVCLFDCY